MKKRALIIGVNSFTGVYLEKELLNNHWEVWGTGTGEFGGSAKYEKINLSEVNKLTEYISEIQPNAIVNLAGISFVASKEVNKIYEVNLLGARNLLVAATQSGAVPESILLASSAQVYGSGHEGVLNEEIRTHPANDYAVSKLSMEHMALTWLDKLPIVLARPFNYTGVGQANHFLIPKIVHHFTKGNSFIELGNVDVWRDFSDVRTVVRCYRMLLECKEAVGEAINICSGRMHSLREVLSMAKEISGREMEIVHNESLVRENEVKVLSGDISKLNSIIGDWEQIPLKNTLEWMLSVGS